MVSGYRNEEGLPKQTIPQAALSIVGSQGQGSPTDPSTVSSDHKAMKPYWDLVDDFDGGVAAMVKGSETYLPMFTRERNNDYQDRLKVARFSNIFGDIVDSLAAKPFAEELKLDAEANDRWVALAENIDGRGNSLHAFAGQTFYDGLRRAIDWILVDFTKANAVPGRALSQAEEQLQGLRPYWVHIAAPTVLAADSAFVGGEEIITHFRFCEDVVERNGFAEVCKRRIRVFDREPIYGPASNSSPSDYAPAKWALYEEQQAAPGGKKEWVVIDQGDVTIGIIPAVPFAVGRRKGSSWQFTPPLRGAAELQVQHYRAENGLVWVSNNTAYPMLSANGVTPEIEAGKIKPIDVGPRSVLYAPLTGQSTRPGSWAFIEPAGASTTFLTGEVDKIEKRMRELGRNPLTTDSGNLTVVTTAFAAQKGNSAVQAWGLLLQIALKRALAITGMWLKDANVPGVKVYTDFAIELDDKGPETLAAGRAKGDISRETWWAEMRRRNILSADFDAEHEQELLDAEAEANLSTAVDMQAALTPDTPPGGGGGPPAKTGKPAKPMAKPKTGAGPQPKPKAA